VGAAGESRVRTLIYIYIYIYRFTTIFKCSDSHTTAHDPELTGFRAHSRVFRVPLAISTSHIYIYIYTVITEQVPASLCGQSIDGNRSSSRSWTSTRISTVRVQFHI
jgi:hypothetical protein